MLVLTRGVGEGIQIGNDIVIRITHVASKYITLSMEAPSELRRSLEPEDFFVPADQAEISLRRHDALSIGFHVRVLVIRIAGARVRLGIDYPREWSVRRIGPE